MTIEKNKSFMQWLEAKHNFTSQKAHDYECYLRNALLCVGNDIGDYQSYIDIKNTLALFSAKNAQQHFNKPQSVLNHYVNSLALYMEYFHNRFEYFKNDGTPIINKLFDPKLLALDNYFEDVYFPISYINHYDNKIKSNIVGSKQLIVKLNESLLIHIMNNAFHKSPNSENLGMLGPRHEFSIGTKHNKHYLYHNDRKKRASIDELAKLLNIPNEFIEKLKRLIAIIQEKVPVIDELMLLYKKSIRRNGTVTSSPKSLDEIRASIKQLFINRAIKEMNEMLQKKEK